VWQLFSLPNSSAPPVGLQTDKQNASPADASENSVALSLFQAEGGISVPAELLDLVSLWSSMSAAEREGVLAVVVQAKARIKVAGG